MLWPRGRANNTALNAPTQNVIARKWLPREVDPLSLDEPLLQQLCHHLNTTPRKCLGYQTPAEVFRHKLPATRR